MLTSCFRGMLQNTLIDELKEASPTVVDELIPSVMKVSEVQQVLHLLLKEDIPIRQLGIILETLGDFAGRTKDQVWLCEIRTTSSRAYDFLPVSRRGRAFACACVGSGDGGPHCSRY